MRSPVLVAALGLAASACGSTALKLGVGLDQPTSVAVFFGVTSKNPDVHPYAAIANGARDDLTLVDALDDQPVPAPVVIRALQVPTAGRPAQVVAASLYDGGADLLAVVLAGSARIQVVRTWTADNQVVPALALDLGDVAEGSEILAVTPAPVPFGGTATATPGRARLVFGLTGGKIAVVEYAREAGGDGGVVQAGPPVVQEVDFEPVSIAASPDARLLYAATPDDVPAGSGRFGVVELDAATPPGTWAAEMLPTRAPTRLVAAGRVAERVWADNDDEIPETSPFVLRVYAALDPAGCGPGRKIECGIVTVDPSPGVRGIPPDPLGEMPYQAPVQLPAEVLAMAVAIPPAVPPSGFQPGRMVLSTGDGARETTGMLAAATANGRIYTVDLGRRTIPNNATMLRDIEGGNQTRTRVGGLGALSQEGETEVQRVRPITCQYATEGLALPFSVDALTNCEPQVDPDSAILGIRVTPGYTYHEIFRITYQGVLRDLSDRYVETGDVGGQLSAALQVRSSSGVSDPVRVYDPALGVYVGDTVEIATRGALAECDGVPDDPATKSIDESELDIHEFVVAAFLPPDPASHPGGALLLADDGSACYGALQARVAPDAPDMTASVRAQAWLLQGDAVGYAGRPVVTTPSDEKDLRATAELRYVNEEAPEQACPLDPWPAQPELVACDADCRARCERLSLARKSRHWYTMADGCNGDAGCQRRWGDPIVEDDMVTGFTEPFPNGLGPVIRLEFTVRRIDDAGVDEPPDAVQRGLGLIVPVESGHDPNYRVAVSGAAVLPTSVVPFDRSPWDAYASYRFFVAYTGDMVMDYSPSQPPNLPVSIR